MTGVRTNQKAQKAIEKKEQNKKENEAKAKLEKDKLEDEKWSRGAKDLTKKAEIEKKKKDAAQKKSEREKLLQEEMDNINTIKKNVRGADKKILAKEREIEQNSRAYKKREEIKEYSAANIDSALDLLTITENRGANEKLERHPERRVKSAWNTFEEREMPLIKAENPGLRLSQYKNMLQKKWKKSSENPMNQTNIQYNTARSDEIEIIKQTRDAKLEGMLIEK